MFDYFITDENGDATFRLKPTAAIMCCGKPPSEPGQLQTDHIKTHTFDVDPATSPAYDTDYGESSVSIFGEWERLPVGGVFLQPGDYSLKLFSPKNPFMAVVELAGNWAAAMGADIEFSVIQDALVIEAEDASIRTAGGIIGGNWCLWSNGTLGELSRYSRGRNL